jgi:hypothetical protein
LKSNHLQRRNNKSMSKPFQIEGGAGRHARGGGGLAEIIKTYVPPKVLTTATSMAAHAYVLAAELFLAFLPPPAPPVQPSRATAAPSSDICVSTPG